MPIIVRPAKKEDHPHLTRMVRQIAQMHLNLRPDIFRPEGQQFDKKQLATMLKDPDRPILVAQNGQGAVLGYVLLQVKSVGGEHPVLRPRQYLLVDGLHVDEAARGQGIGALLMDATREVAKSRGIGNIELNVWECNEGAMRFYERLGFTTQRRTLELDI